MLMGWSLIGLIVLNIVVNFGSIIVKDFMTVCTKLKIYLLKKRWAQNRRESKERRDRINLYRKTVLNDFAK